MCEQSLEKAGLRSNIVIDCSHGNSLKADVQPLVLIVRQIRGNTSIAGSCSKAWAAGHTKAIFGEEYRRCV